MIASDKALAGVASESNGVVTREQAREHLTDRQVRYRVATGALVPLAPSVYRLAGTPVTWHQRLWAVQAWAARRFAFSHRTAAALHGLGDGDEAAIELTSTRRMRVPEGVHLYRVEALSHAETMEVDGFTVTKVARTLIDLCAKTDRPTLRSKFDLALREKKTTLEELKREIGRSKNRPGVCDARELVHELSGADGPTESVLEELCLELIASAGLRRPRVQWSTIAGNQRRRLDLFFEAQGVVIEADGYASHSGIDAFEDDRLRNNSLIVQGLRVLHWTWTALHDRPDELIAELYVALNLR